MSWKRIGLTSIYVTISTVSTQMLQWIIMSSLAHRDGPKMLGIYALGQAFALPLQYLSFLAIRPRYLSIQEHDMQDNFFAMRAIFPALAYITALVIIYILYGLSTIWLMSACILMLKYVEGFYDLAYAKMQRDNQAASLAKVSVFRSSISAVLFLVCYRVTNLYISIMVIAVQQALICISLRNQLKAFKPITSPLFAFRISAAVSLLPFAVTAVLSSLSSSMPRLILNGLMGAKELGYYTAVITFISIGQIAVGSVGQSLLTPISQALHQKDDGAFWTRILAPVILTQLGCYAAAVGCYFLGGVVVRVVYGPEFGPAEPLLVTASITSGPFFAASLLTAALFATGKKYSLVINQVMALCLMMLLTLWLVPIFHAKGAFLAMGISGVCQMILCFAMLAVSLKNRDQTRAKAAALFR